MRISWLLRVKGDEPCSLQDRLQGLGLAERASLLITLDGLCRQAKVALDLEIDGRVLAQVEAAWPEVLNGVAAVEGPSDWNRATLMVREGLRWIIDGPMLRSRCALSPAALSMLENCQRKEGNVLRGLLVALGAIGGEPLPSHWPVHDAWFEQRSRRPRVGQGLGRWPGAEGPAVEPDPVKRPRDSGEPSTPLAQLFRARSSQREWGEQLTLPDLEHLLGAVVDLRGPGRAWPSGGGCYPLQVYVAVERCAGAKPGLYTLKDRALSSCGPALPQAFDRAEQTMQRPPALLIVSAEFERTQKRYQGLALRLMLLEAGALMQSLNLAAVEQGLACCWLGAGESVAFSSAINKPPWLQSSIAELAVGTRP